VKGLPAAAVVDDDDDENDAHLYGREEGYDPRDVVQWETDDELRAERADTGTRLAWASRGERCPW
jgi:hypothetical protein